MSRRELLRAGLAMGVGATAATAVVRGGASVAGEPGATLTSTVVKGAPGQGGYVPTEVASGDPLIVRTDLGLSGRPAREVVRTPVLAFVHLTDVHLLDAQSPMRLECVDEFREAGLGRERATYRPQEMLTAQVAEAMVRALERNRVGPVTGQRVAFALQTGDNTDNTQHNEIRWNIDLLDGGVVRADSGDLHRWEGVASNDPAWWDTRYWHPDGPPSGTAHDRPQAKYGFPTVPGLLDAVRRPFRARGLRMPWYTAFGNHDQLIDGIWHLTSGMQDVALGDRKLVRLPPAFPKGMFNALALRDYPKLLSRPDMAPFVRHVTPDPGRRLLSAQQLVDEHFTTTGTPVGHGFTPRNRTDGTAYYTFDHGPVRFIVLDTVDPAGGSRGSLDRTQFGWLRAKLAGSRDRLVVVASHHTSNTMTSQGRNGFRVQGAEVVQLLLEHDQVIAWFNGHSHRNQVWARRRAGGGGFWEVNTASHIDWPQQSRLVEISDNHDGTLSIFTTMVDHRGLVDHGGRLDAVEPLAGLARELAANDWQERNSGRRGVPSARNVELLLARPRLHR